MRSSHSLTLFDALYGEIMLDSEIFDLLFCPLVQRLRHIRLSNIDSLTMPGIANLSRYEHSIGVSYLASRVGFASHLSYDDRLVIQAAALIHDTAITPFGHLAEEALRYVLNNYDHEAKWSILFGSSDFKELGGIDLQVYLGYESGLRRWANRSFGVYADERLKQIFDALTGKGVYGKCIAGDMDLDNLDNVTRIAYHMGIEVDKKLPIIIAESMEGVSENQGIIFSDSSLSYIQNWLQLRDKVYSHLMLSREDFCGKTMLLSAAVMAYERGYIAPTDWTLTDREFVGRLLETRDDDVAVPVKRWLLGDLWSLSELFWMEGDPPDFADIYSFGNTISMDMKRHCFAYRIKDKRNRRLTLALNSSKLITLGKAPTKWLLGIASPGHRAFSSEENKKFIAAASKFFSTRYLGSSKTIEHPAYLFEAI